MILRSNLRAAGLVDEGRPFEGTYAGAFDGAGELVGVAACYWNGVVALEASAGIPALVESVRAAAPRAAAGFLGPAAQVAEALACVGDVPLQLDSVEILYALDLRELAVPAALERGEVAARLLQPQDDALAVEWRIDYAREALNLERSSEAELDARESIVRLREARQAWLLESGGSPVSFTAFNAALPGQVQVGGVWTPPELRGRGYARAAVAASLLDARAAGVARSVLFTDRENVAAERCYESLGYRPVGDYRIVRFAHT